MKLGLQKCERSSIVLERGRREMPRKKRFANPFKISSHPRERSPVLPNSDFATEFFPFLQRGDLSTSPLRFFKAISQEIES